MAVQAALLEFVDANNPGPGPLVSVVIVNYNGAAWMRRCLASLQAQTSFAQTEIIIADNASTDGSNRLSQELLRDWPNGVFLQTGANLGFAGACNRAVALARGRYLFFLNPDVWLEPACLEELVRTAEAAGAGAVGPLIRDYDDDTFQSLGGVGFDLGGFGVGGGPTDAPRVLFAACGFYFIRTDLYRRLGGFDETFFLYGEETDLSWRVWIAGSHILHAPGAVVHHRGAVAVNPEGGTKLVESRTSESKRFYAHRNHLLTLLKNCRHLLLLMLVPALALLTAETAVGLLLVRRWSFARKSLLAPLAEVWRMRARILAARRHIRSFRRRGDFWMLRFLRLRPGHWEDFKRMFRLGLPKVDSR